METPSQDLDIRRSSFRKVSVFLRHFSKLRLFSLKEQGGVISVTNVQRAHDLFRGVKIEDREEFLVRVAAASSTRKDGLVEDEDAEGGSSEFSKSMARQQAAAMKGSGDMKINVLELFKLTKQLREIFGSIHGSHGEYLTAQEVNYCLFRQHRLCLLFFYLYFYV